MLVVTLVVGPALTKPRATARLTDCLSNLQHIGMALHAYAAEDPREQAIPIQLDMVNNVALLGPTSDAGYWLWRTANCFAWGGQSATRVFKTSARAGYALADTPPQDGNSIPCVQRVDYAASRRPLNGCIAPDPLDVFHCPADTGYPNDPRIDDAPGANALRSCWDTLGNSYRASLTSYTQTGGGLAPSTGSFSFGSWGHRLSTLPSQSTSVLVADPLWSYQLSTLLCYDCDPNVIPVGWHGTPWADNVLYADGSARLTSVQGARRDLVRRPLGADSLALAVNAPPVCDLGLLCAGPSWQVDCYPTPGAVIWGNWSQYIQQYNNCWPFKNAYLNPLARAPGDAPRRVPPGEAAGESAPSAVRFVP